MDNGQGIFEPISQEKFAEQMQETDVLVFSVGEIIEVRGSRLRVESIKRNKITFKLLKRLKNARVTNKKAHR